MRPVVKIIETDAGYVVRCGRRQEGPVLNFMAAVAIAQRLVPGGVVLSPGEKSDTDIVAVGYAADALAWLEAQAS